MLTVEFPVSQRSGNRGERRVTRRRRPGNQMTDGWAGAMVADGRQSMSWPGLAVEFLAVRAFPVAIR